MTKRFSCWNFESGVRDFRHFQFRYFCFVSILHFDLLLFGKLPNKTMKSGDDDTAATGDLPACAGCFSIATRMHTYFSHKTVSNPEFSKHRKHSRLSCTHTAYIHDPFHFIPYPNGALPSAHPRCFASVAVWRRTVHCTPWMYVLRVARDCRSVGECVYTISGAYLRYTNMYNFERNTYTKSTAKQYTTTEDEMRWLRRKKKQNKCEQKIACSDEMKWMAWRETCVYAVRWVCVCGKLIREKRWYRFCANPTMSHTLTHSSTHEEKSKNQWQEKRLRVRAYFWCADWVRRCYRSQLPSLSPFCWYFMLLFWRTVFICYDWRTHDEWNNFTFTYPLAVHGRSLRTVRIAKWPYKRSPTIYRSDLIIEPDRRTHISAEKQIANGTARNISKLHLISRQHAQYTELVRCVAVAVVVDDDFPSTAKCIHDDTRSSLVYAQSSYLYMQRRRTMSLFQFISF